jgi:hypothetical protein
MPDYTLTPVHEPAIPTTASVDRPPVRSHSNDGTSGPADKYNCVIVAQGSSRADGPVRRLSGVSPFAVRGPVV